LRNEKRYLGAAKHDSVATLVTHSIDYLSEKASDVAPIVRKVEDQTARPINPVILSASEAQDRLKTGHHFLDSVRKANKVFLWSERSELGEALRRER
jgi:hypothetical protein